MQSRAFNTKSEADNDGKSLVKPITIGDRTFGCIRNKDNDQNHMTLLTIDISLPLLVTFMILLSSVDRTLLINKSGIHLQSKM